MSAIEVVDITAVDEINYTLLSLTGFKGKEASSLEFSQAVRVLEKKDTNELLVLVLSDYQTHTEFYDFIKFLRKNRYKVNIDYCDRKRIEKITNQFTGEHIAADDQSSWQEVVMDVIKSAVNKRASDIHIRVQNKYTNVYFRVDGKMRFHKEGTTEWGRKLINTLYNTMCEERTTTTVNYSTSMDAKIREEFVSSLGLSTGRFSSRPGGSGAGGDMIVVVIRLIGRRKSELKLEQLGLTEKEVEIIKRVVGKPSGVIFSSGPTGHGKSTLSQCMAEMVTAADPGVNLMTIEDPIESPISGAYQTPLMIGDRNDRELLGEAWAASIKNTMRLDPDWIYIGEVRDGTSATGTIVAAQTGHNVITTIHTRYPIDVIARLKNLGVDSDLITDPTLITCLIGLRLTPLLCPGCKLPYENHKQDVEKTLRKLIEKHTVTENLYIKNEGGCNSCSFTGVKGRTGVFEIIEPDAEFMRLYHEQGKIQAYEYWYRNGGITLCDNTLRLVNSGSVDPLSAHKDVCNLDRDTILFSEGLRNEVTLSRLEKVSNE